MQVQDKLLPGLHMLAVRAVMIMIEGLGYDWLNWQPNCVMSTSVQFSHNTYAFRQRKPFSQNATSSATSVASLFSQAAAHQQGNSWCVQRKIWLAWALVCLPAVWQYVFAQC